MDSPLFEAYANLNPVLSQGSEWKMPLRYSTLEQEYRSVREHVGLIDLSHRGKIRLTGPDRVSFLNNIVTNDIASLKSGKGARALLLNNKGRILADLKVYLANDSLLIETDPETRRKTMEILERLHVSEDVKIEDYTDRMGLVSVQGPHAEKAVNWISERVRFLENEFDHMKELSIGDDVTIARFSGTGETGYDLQGSPDVMKKIWTNIVRNGSAVPVGLEALDVLRLEAGILVYGQDMSEDNIALEPGLKGVISSSKGCYVGQEVVARATYIGKISKTLVGLSAETSQVLRKGDKLVVDERSVGQVTSSVYSPHFKKVLALGYVGRDYARPGTQVTIVSASTNYVGTIEELPFYR